MVVTTETTKESLRLTLADRSFLGYLVSARNNAKACRPAAFKRDLEAWIGRLANAISASILSPKTKDFSIDSSIMYLAITILDQPKLYARLSYYFDDKDYLSIDTGVRFYNELLKALVDLLKFPYLEELYLRVMSVDKMEAKEVRDTLHFGTLSVDVSVRRPCYIKNDILYPEMIFEFYDNDDPNAMCKLFLYDEHLKGHTRPIIFPLDGKRIKRSFFFELGHESLGAHSKALLGARVMVSHRVPALRNGKTTFIVESQEQETVLSVYLLPQKK